MGNSKTIFLSASIPDHERDLEYYGDSDSLIQMNEIIVSLTRAIIGRNGKIVFGGHPSITPLVGMVAYEYLDFTEVEGPSSFEPNFKLEIYQSEAFRGFLPDTTWQLFKSELAEINWVEAVDRERYNPEINKPQCTKSLTLMRENMIKNSNPAAMIIVGGMQGVVEEALLFDSTFPGRPIYGFEYGLHIGNQLREKVDLNFWDTEMLEILRSYDSRERKDDFREEIYKEFIENAIEPIPYPIICQSLVDQIFGDSNSLFR